METEDAFFFIIQTFLAELDVQTSLEIPVRITDHVHHATTVRQSCVNFNNLISITTQHSRVSVNRFQSSLKLLFCGCE